MRVFSFYFTCKQRKRSAEGSDEEKETPGKHEKKKSKKDKKKSKEKESSDEVSIMCGIFTFCWRFIATVPEILCYMNTHRI